MMGGFSLWEGALFLFQGFPFRRRMWVEVGSSGCDISSRRAADSKACIDSLKRTAVLKLGCCRAIFFQGWDT